MPRIPDRMLHAALDQLPLTVRGAQQLSDPSALLAYIDHIHIRTNLEASIGKQRAAALREQAARGALSLSALNEVLFTYPTWIYYRDGTRVLVESPQKLAQQPPGYSCFAVGPWLDGLTDADVSWKPGQGPFASAPMGYQMRMNGFWEWFSPKGAPNLVYVTRPLIYAGWARAAYELVYLTDIRNDVRLLGTGDLVLVPNYGTRSQRTRHELTSRCFLDEEGQEEYARLYEDGDITGWVADLQTGTTAPETSGTDVPASSVPKVPRRLLCYAIHASFYQALILVIDAFWKRYERTGQYPTKFAVTSKEHQKLWPEGFQPDRKQLNILLTHHEIDYNALVEERKAVLFPTGI